MRIDELVLAAGDLAALRAFYTGVLGLVPVPGAGDTLTIQAGRSRLAFQHAGANRPGYYHVAFEVPEHQLPEAKAWLARRVPLIVDQQGRDQFHFASWNSDSVYFYDPAGNILEFIARHNRPTGADAPFGAASIRAVSEIGLTCADVPRLVQRLRDAMGLEVYAGGAGADFAPVGDEDGLLIVVQQGRIWFPDTAQPAVYGPLALRLRMTAGAAYRLTGPPYVVRPGR